MRYRCIPKTDLNVSCLCLGTWVFGGDFWGGTKEQDALGAVKAAKDYGINFIDTAPIYGNGRSEEIVGRAIKGQRDQWVIASKCGLQAHGKQILHNLKPESVLKEIDDSLRRLRTEYIDIYQIHWPDPQTPLRATLEALCRIKDQGKIKHIGVSNFSRELMEEALQVTDIVTLQNQYSLLDRSLEEIKPYCVERNIGIISYGPLAGGILTGKYTEEPKLPKADARSFFYKYYQGDAFKKVQDFLRKLEALGYPLNHVALNWVCRQEGISSVLVGCRNAAQVKDNAAAADLNLTQKQIEWISGLTH